MSTNSDAVNERLIREHTAATDAGPLEDGPESEMQPRPGPQMAQPAQGQPGEGGLEGAGLTGHGDRFDDDPASGVREEEYYDPAGAGTARAGEADTARAGEDDTSPAGEDDTIRAGEEDTIRASEDDTAGVGEQGSLAATHEPGAFPLDGEAMRRTVAHWREIQAGFVDDPRSAVEQADALVTDLVRRMTAMLTHERAVLERGQAGGEADSTEVLRQSLRRYRSLFERLLAG